MKRVHIVTRATATIEETWVWEVADDFEVSDNLHPDALSEMADNHEAAFVSVRDEVIGDETDRHVLSVQVVQPA